MTPDCIEEVDGLQQESETFCDLTVEQLLYACVVAVGLEETRLILEHTNWSKWCPNEQRNQKLH